MTKQRQMIPEIRVVKDGKPGEILPDWRTIGFMDDCFDIGVLNFEYPKNTGRNRSLLTDKVELALFIDGEEIDGNSRFVFDEESGNRTEDTPGYVSFACPSYLSVLEDAIIVPKRVKKKDDQHSDEEQETTEKWMVDRTGEQQVTERIAAGDDATAADSTTAVDAQVDEMGFAVARAAADEKDDESDDESKDDKSKKEPPKGPLFKKVTVGEMLIDLIRTAKGRGAIPNLLVDFTKDRDSAGKKWDVLITARPEVGSSILEVVQWMHDEKAAEIRCHGRTLQAFNSNTGKERAEVLFAKGKNIIDGPRQRSTRDVFSAVYVVSDAGPHGWVVDKDLRKKFHRRESYLSLQGVDDWSEAKERGQNYLKKQGQPKEQITYGVSALEGVRPYVDYQMADWVYVLDTQSVPEKMRVRVLTIDWDDAGVPSVGITMNDRLYEKSITANRKTRKITGKTQVITMNSAARGVAEDGRAPARTSAPQVSTRGGVARVTYDGYDEDGLDPIWDQDHVEVHVGDTEDFVEGRSTLLANLNGPGSVVVTEAGYDTVKYVKFVPVDSGGDRGPASAVVEIVVERQQIEDGDLNDGSEPDVPDAYWLGGIGTIFLKWAPIINGADNPRYRVYGSETEAGCVPGPSTYYGEVEGAMAVVRNMPNGDPFPFEIVVDSEGHEDKQYLDTYWCVTAVDRDGESEPSPIMVGRPAQVTGPDIAVNTVTTNMLIANSITAEKIDFETLRGETVIGLNIMTGDPGTNYMQMTNDGAAGVIRGYSGLLSELAPAEMNPDIEGSGPVFRIKSGRSTAATNAAQIRLNAGNGSIGGGLGGIINLDASGINANGGLVCFGGLSVWNATDFYGDVYLNSLPTTVSPPNLRVFSGGRIYQSTYDLAGEISGIKARLTALENA